MMNVVQKTLLSRNEHSLGVIHSWLRSRKGTFIRAEYTNAHVRLIWRGPLMV